MDIPFGTVDWIDNLRFDKEHKLALITDVGEFRDCTMELDGKDYIIWDFSRTKRGWIQYDVVVGKKSNKDFFKKRCVVVGKKSNKDLFKKRSVVVGKSNKDIFKKDIFKERCVVVGKKSNKDGNRLDIKEYYILVVRPTRVDGEYKRVGVGLIQSDYVVRQRFNVRVM